MTRRAFWTTALAVAVIAPFARAEQPAKDTQSLDGTWKVVALKSGDKEAPEEVFRNWRWEIKGKVITITASAEESMKITANFDPSKSPATVDMTALDGPTKDKTVKGIYELKQDKLRVCLGGFDAPDNVRPTDFSGERGRGLITLERVKKP